ATPQVQLFRFFDGTRHSHMLNRYEGQAAGLRLENDDVHLMQEQGRGASMPVYRCVTTDGIDHFLSPDEGCEGQSGEGLLGWAFPVAVPGTTPLYRCYQPGHRDHLATKHPEQECTAATGLVKEGLLGYLPDANPFPFLDDQHLVLRSYNRRD